jgi:hypothetical protein
MYFTCLIIVRKPKNQSQLLVADVCLLVNELWAMQVFVLYSLLVFLLLKIDEDCSHSSHVFTVSALAELPIHRSRSLQNV